MIMLMLVINDNNSNNHVSFPKKLPFLFFFLEIMTNQPTIQPKERKGSKGNYTSIDNSSTGCSLNIVFYSDF